MSGVVHQILIYWGVFFALAALLSAFTRSGLKDTLLKYLPLAVVMQLFYSLVQLRITLDIDSLNPYRMGGRGVYSLYAKGYFYAVLVALGVAAGWARGRKDALVNIMAVGSYVYLLYSFLRNGNYLLAVSSTVLIGCAYAGSESIRAVWRRAMTFLSDTSKNEKMIMWAIFILSLSVRYFFALRIMSITGDRFLLSSDDGQVYGPYGALWAGGSIPPDGLYWGGFGYWVFLGMIFKVFGVYNYYMATFFQSAAGALVPVLVFYLSRRLFNDFTAYLAAIFTALDMNLIFLTVVIGMESIYIPIVYIVFAVILTYFNSKDRISAVRGYVTGLLMGLANTVRIEFSYFPFVVAGIIILSYYRDAGLKKVFMIAIALLLGFFSVLTVHCWRNYSNYGKFTYKTEQAAMCFTKGINGSDENQRLAEMGFNPFKDAKGAIGVFVNNPSTVSKLLIKGFFKRAKLFFFIPNFGTFDAVSLVNPDSGFVLLYPVSLVLYGYILAVTGVIYSLIKKKRCVTLNIIYVYILYTMSLYALIMVTNARHRGVVVPFFYMFLSYGLYEIIRSVRSLRERSMDEKSALG